MDAQSSRDRRAKGTNLIELVRFLRHTRKVRSLPRLSPAAEKLMDERILPSTWYAHSTFIELVEFTFEHILRRSQQAAYELGASGGREQMGSGVHRALVSKNDPRSSVMAMRHTWRAHFNFGALRAEAVDEGVLFTLTGYRDVRPAHGYMIAGWGAAAAQVSGGVSTRAVMVKCPWEGAEELVYRIELGALLPAPSAKHDLKR